MLELLLKSIQESSGNKGAAEGEELANILKYIIEAGKIEKLSSQKIMA